MDLARGDACLDLILHTPKFASRSEGGCQPLVVMLIDVAAYHNTLVAKYATENRYVWQDVQH